MPTLAPFTCGHRSGAADSWMMEGKCHNCRIHQAVCVVAQAVLSGICMPRANANREASLALDPTVVCSRRAVRVESRNQPWTVSCRIEVQGPRHGAACLPDLAPEASKRHLQCRAQSGSRSVLPGSLSPGVLRCAWAKRWHRRELVASSCSKRVSANGRPPATGRFGVFRGATGGLGGPPQASTSQRNGDSGD